MKQPGANVANVIVYKARISIEVSCEYEVALCSDCWFSSKKRWSLVDYNQELETKYQLALQAFPQNGISLTDPLDRQTLIKWLKELLKKKASVFGRDEFKDLLKTSIQNDALEKFSDCDRITGWGSHIEF